MACARKKLAEFVGEGDGYVVVRTPKHGRLLRFTLHGARGVRETREDVRRVAGHAPAPVAFVGSSNTVLTVAMAESLRDAAAANPGEGPVLLVPWASSVLAERSDPGEGPVALLDVDAGRTFRFCLNNQYMADLIVKCLGDLEPDLPAKRVVIVEDRYDPYSTDLSACFHRAVERAVPAAEFIEMTVAPPLPLPHDPSLLPTPAEEAVAESVWRDADRLPHGQTLWVVLPLQEEPTLRMIQALSRHARRTLHAGSSPLRVVCGDAVGASNLARIAGRCPVPVWCVSSASPEAPAKGVSHDVQIPAEIVASLVRCLDLPGDRPASAGDLRRALAGMKLAADDPSALGRSLAFSRSGERVGDDLGHVLMIRPDEASVHFVTRGREGRWRGPTPLAADFP